MKGTKRLPYGFSFVAGICLVFALASFSAAQSGSWKGQTGQSATKAISGTLVKVDSSMKTLTIKTKQGEEMDFHYTDNTRVEGAQGGIQGLAAKDGSELTVHYIQKPDSNYRTAVSIKVESPKS